MSYEELLPRYPVAATSKLILSQQAKAGFARRAAHNSGHFNQELRRVHAFWLARRADPTEAAQ